MKNKAPLVLIEFLIMLLVFSISAALCLRVFSFAATMSKETAIKDAAIIEAQNAAEILVFHKGDMPVGTYDNISPVAENKWDIDYDKFTLKITVADESSDLFGSGTVTAVGLDGNVIIQFPVTWQKEGVK